MLCSGLRHCVASKLHSGAGLRQNPHDLEALLAVCAWFHAETNAAQEMLAFEPQRLPLLDGDRNRLGPDRGRPLASHTHLVWIQKQLATPGLTVVEHDHRFRADHREPMLLEG